MQKPKWAWGMMNVILERRLLDALSLTFGNLAVSKRFSKAKQR